MKKVLFGLAILIAGFISFSLQHPTANSPAIAAAGNEVGLAEAIESGRSNVQVHDRGLILRLLADDNTGSRHQRFVLRLASGQTVLIAHNIDLAPRIEALRAGDEIEFYGEYEWSSKGGVVHWTHRDPNGRHPAGWIRHGGRTYQ